MSRTTWIDKTLDVARDVSLPRAPWERGIRREVTRARRDDPWMEHGRWAAE